jgi:dGTPase
MLMDLIVNSWKKPVIRRSPVIQEATDALRTFLFANVYIGSEAKREESRARHVIQDLFAYFTRYPLLLPEEHRQRAEAVGTRRAVCDYIAGMTDNYAVAQFTRLFIPRAFPLPELKP